MGTAGFRVIIIRLGRAITGMQVIGRIRRIGAHFGSGHATTAGDIIAATGDDRLKNNSRANRPGVR